MTISLPMVPQGSDPVRGGVPQLSDAELDALRAEIRQLAKERGAVILAHNYQLPEIQDIADVAGDSLGLSIEAAKTEADLIVFCGVHFMAETASVLSPDKTVLIPDVNAGCSLADSINAEQLADWQAKNPGAITAMYVNTTAEVKALTDYCITSSNAVPVVEAIYREHGDDVPVLCGPDMFLGSYIEKRINQDRAKAGKEPLKNFHVWDGECHVHAGIRPADITKVRGEHPGAEFLIHPECGCSTQVMEYVASGDVNEDDVHMLSTGGMIDFVNDSAKSGDDISSNRELIIATETGMIHQLRKAAPNVNFIPANNQAACGYMKMITLPKLRDCLRDMTGVVKVPNEIAEKARIPIERMVSIGRDANAPLGGE